MNSQRDFITEICQEENITLESLSQGYVLRLTKDNISRTIYGPYWAINSAAADRIACDKCACYTLLHQSGIPAIGHALLTHPVKHYGWTGEKGVLAKVLDFFNKYKTVVIKPNQGSNGHGVFFCDNIHKLEHAVQTVFAMNADAAISPFYDIKTEYRVFYFNGECHFVYGKTKSETDWRHNLSQGATAFEIESPHVYENLATKAAKAIDINFATVDIAELKNGKLAVMEINAGVQAKQLLEQLPHLRSTIKNIYAMAIRGMF